MLCVVSSASCQDETKQTCENSNAQYLYESILCVCACMLRALHRSVAIAISIAIATAATIAVAIPAAMPGCQKQKN
jgi:2-methylaconitate cis-trans-isomerase PrpF